MNRKAILLIVSVFLSALSYAQIRTIELPLTVKDGKGPFKSSLGAISPYSEDKDNPWEKTWLKTTGIPSDWTDVKKGDIETNMYQTVYQHFLLGNITRERYEYLQKSWNWIPDTRNLSKEPLKCKIAFAYGKDPSGETKLVVDANNNRDFSDDVPFVPVEIDLNKKSDLDSISNKNAIVVSFERLSGNKIILQKAPLFIMHTNNYNTYMCNFPQYASVQLDGEEIAVCSDDYATPSYKSTSIVLINDSIRSGKKANYDSIIVLDEFIKIKGNFYRNKGVNLNKNVLVLEKTNLPQNQLVSTQVGFKTLNFAGKNFKTKANISLDDYKGKYLLIDFWAVWCGPCIQEMPNMKALYDKSDKSKIEILGIVGGSSSDGLIKSIDKNSITWPQILSDETNKITNKYGINSYPTTLLINPEGIIVAKNLRGKELEDKIKELIAR